MKIGKTRAKTSSRTAQSLKKKFSNSLQGAKVKNTRKSLTISTQISPSISSGARRKMENGTSSGTSSSRTFGLSQSTAEVLPVLLPGAKSHGLCSACGIVELTAKRQDHKVDGTLVPNLLVSVCDGCGEVVGIPQESAGRIYAAKYDKATMETLECRLQPEVEDIALAIHAFLGIEPHGDPFAVPIQLGIRAAIGRQTPFVLDLRSSKASERARPRLSQDALERLRGLREAWKLDSDAEAVRSLVGLAWLSLQGRQKA